MKDLVDTFLGGNLREELGGEVDFSYIEDLYVRFDKAFNEFCRDSDCSDDELLEVIDKAVSMIKENNKFLQSEEDFDER